MALRYLLEGLGQLGFEHLSNLDTNSQNNEAYLKACSLSFIEGVIPWDMGIWMRLLRVLDACQDILVLHFNIT